MVSIGKVGKISTRDIIIITSFSLTVLVTFFVFSDSLTCAFSKFFSLPPPLARQFVHEHLQYCERACVNVLVRLWGIEGRD